MPQNDVGLEGLVVREHLYFMVRAVDDALKSRVNPKSFQIELKLPKLSAQEKLYLLESSLVKFGLNGDTILQHLSGGEKRKLSLASEVRRSFIARRIASINHFFRSNSC